MADLFYPLKPGHIGADVCRLQRFLLAQGFAIPGGTDGNLGPATSAAIAAFQREHGLPESGAFGQDDARRAVGLGYENTCFQGASHAAYPPAPKHLKRPDHQASDAMFGTFEFRLAKSDTARYQLEIEEDWLADNICQTSIPQLIGMVDRQFAKPRVLKDGKITCHRLAAPRLQALFAAWETAGLMDRVIYFTGCFNARLKRRETELVRSNLSNHSWGGAFDINSQENWIGQAPAAMGQRGCLFELVHIANEEGFFWGGHFDRVDGMHFEIAEL